MNGKVSRSASLVRELNFQQYPKQPKMPSHCTGIRDLKQDTRKSYFINYVLISFNWWMYEELHLFLELLSICQHAKMLK